MLYGVGVSVIWSGSECYKGRQRPSIFLIFHIIAILQ